MSDTNHERKIPKLIYVMGIDGSGKSTVSEHLAGKLRAMGYNVNVEWFRFNHYFSKPLLGLCRLIGLTRYETHGSIRVGYHNFHRSRIISFLFTILQYLDAARVLYFKILPKLRSQKDILILDRYVYDILVDVMVDTGKDKLYGSRLGNAFKHLLPDGSLLLLVDRNLDDVLEARPEGRVDRNFKKRYMHYKRISNDDSIVTITNDGRLEDLLLAAESRVGLVS